MPAVYDPLKFTKRVKTDFLFHFWLAFPVIDRTKYLFVFLVFFYCLHTRYVIVLFCTLLINQKSQCEL